MSVLAPTPPERMVDAQGRPYFLWEEDITLEVFRRRLVDPDPEVRAYYLGKLMRQAKPDDVFTFATLREIRELFPLLGRYLGRTREFWIWVLAQWKVAPRGAGEAIPASAADPCCTVPDTAQLDLDGRRRARRLPPQTSRDA